VNWSHSAAVETLNAMTMKFQALGTDANAAALRTISNMVRREALVMSFADVFLLLTFLFLGLVCALPFIDKPRAAPAGGGGH
jgi:DHA2 family multidrug resistance protein